MSPRKEVLAEGVECWLGDCREILPSLGQFDAVVTDPPYGIGFEYNSHEDVGGDQYIELLSHISAYPRVVLQYPEEMMRYMVPMWGAPDDVYTWCYNSNTNRQTRLWGFWGIKPEWAAVRQKCKNPTDLRVSSFVRSYDWCSDIQQIKNVSEEKTCHPCQVSSELVSRVIRFSCADHVVDPFLGSGTTGVASVMLGKRFTGIEIDSVYFDIACRRISDALRQPDMFSASTLSVSQEGLSL